jgi:hypothetical protein
MGITSDAPGAVPPGAVVTRATVGSKGSVGAAPPAATGGGDLPKGVSRVAVARNGAPVASMARPVVGAGNVALVSRAAPRGLLIAMLAATVATMPRPAAAKRAKGPTQIVPTKQGGKDRRSERRADVDRSEGGTRRGVLELTLGSVVAGTSGLLVGRGIWELVQSRRTERACDRGVDSIDCQFANPGRQGRIAAGLSFGFAAVIGVAAGFLLTRGVRINRDHREFQAAQARVSVRPWASVQQPAGGVSLQLRF